MDSVNIYGNNSEWVSDFEECTICPGLLREVRDKNSDCLIAKIVYKDILASTSKLGTGANVQDRVAAIHHLDTPWRPADLTQQNGRGLRQGNMFKEVGVYHYVTENTFDAYMLGIITNKAKFISQVMTSKDTSRTCEDVDEMVLNYSEMQAIASGNPMIKEKIQLDMDVSRLRTLENEYHKNLYKMQEMAQVTLPEQINKNTELLEKAKADLETVKANLPSSDEFMLPRRIC